MTRKALIRFLAGSSLAAVASIGFAACATTRTVETEYTPGGQVATKRTKVNDDVISELRRVFNNTIIEGEGVIENANEGLARMSATELALNELASKVQSTTKRDSVIYNAENVRNVVETQVRALVQNYKIDFAGYDPGTKKYRVKVSVTGESLVREIETRIQ